MAKVTNFLGNQHITILIINQLMMDQDDGCQD